MTDSLGGRLDRALAAKEWDTALELLKDWTVRRPDDSNGWFWRALCHSRLEQTDAALESARKAAALDAENPRIRQLLSSLDRAFAGAAAGTEVPAPQPTLTGEVDALPRTETEDDRGETVPLASPKNIRWSKGTVVEGRYEIREVRSGGMGEVYIVFDRAQAMQLAVKTPLPKTLETANGRLRFLREAEAWIGLGLHPHICTAYYVQEIGGVARLFIEFVDGCGLDTVIKDDSIGGLGPGLDLAIQIAAGMHHAHTFDWVDDEGHHHRGLAHRDLKPANILLDSNRVPKVTDFGLVGRGFEEADPHLEAVIQAPDPAVAVSGSDTLWKTVTLGGGMMGTPPYMPPEQWGGGHGAGKPADIYAFGCILFEILCGRRPFELDQKERSARPEYQLARIESLHREATPPTPRDLNPELDSDLEALMLECLAKTPESRPGSFAELRNRLIEAYARATGTPYARPDATAHHLLGDALNNQGVSYATIGQFKKAEDAWSRALDQDPGHREATFNLCLHRWKNGTASHDELLLQVTDLTNGDRRSWKHLHLGGKLALAAGAPPRAAELLQQAYTESRGLPEVGRDFAMALIGDPAPIGLEERRRKAGRVLARCGGPFRADPAVLTAYAFAMDEVDEKAKAVELFRRARRQDPTLPESLRDGARRLIPGTSFVRRLEGFAGRVLRIATDAAGRRAVTVLYDGSLCIWDLAVGEIQRMIRPPGPRTRCIAMDPEGRWVFASAEGEPVTIWDAETGVAQHRLQAHAGFLNDLRNTPDGRRLAGVGTTGTLYVWNVQTRQLEADPTVHRGFLTALAVALDQKTFVTGGSDGAALVIDIDESTVLAALPPGEHDTTAVALSPGARWAVIGDESGSIRICDVESNQCRHTLQGHRQAIRRVSFDQQDTTLLSVDRQGIVRTWDLETGRLLTSADVGEETHSADATPTLATVLLGHGTAGISQFDLSLRPETTLTWAIASPVTFSEADERARRFQDHLRDAKDSQRNGATGAALDAVARARAIPGYARNAEALDLGVAIGAACRYREFLGGWQVREDRPHGAKIHALRLSPAPNTVGTVGADGTLKVWDTRTGDTLRDLGPVNPPDLDLAFLAGSNRCVSAGLENKIRIWDLEDPESPAVLKGHEAQVNALSSIDNRIVSGSSDQNVRVWDSESRVCLRVFDGHSKEVVAVRLAPDGRRCASACEDELLIWDSRTGVDLLSLAGHPGGVSAIAWSGDGRTLLSGCRGGEIRLWDGFSGHCLRTLTVGDPIDCLTRSFDDRFALAGTRSGEIQLWDLRARHRLTTFEGHLESVRSVAFSRDGSRCFSAGAEGTVRQWFLDWAVDVSEDSKSQIDQVKPHLEVFLARKSDGEGPPRWKEADLAELRTEIRDRRLGFFSIGDITAEIQQLATEWDTREDPATVVLKKAGGRAPSTKRRRAARKALIRRSVTGLLLVIAVGVIASVFQHARLRINADRADFYRKTAYQMQIPYGVNLGPIPECSPALFGAYLRVFTRGSSEPDSIDQAARCLGLLDDPRAIAPLMELIRPFDRSDGLPEINLIPASRKEVLSILVAIGEPGSAELERLLVDRDAVVRNTAADALAAIGGESTVEILVRASESREPVTRIAVARTLGLVAVSGAIDAEASFAVFNRLADDPYPEVRTQVARHLEVFRGSRPQNLLDELQEDTDPEVRDAAINTIRHLNSE